MDAGRDPGRDDVVMRDDVLAPFAGQDARLLACVHCGFCLDACPTYTRVGVEADSPRGRLYLMRAVAEGRIEPDADAFATHIDRCLGCRACEPVCPSGVQYGLLLERARDVIRRANGVSPLDRALLRTFGNRTLSRAVSIGGRILRSTGIAALFARILPHRMERTRFALAMLASSRAWKGLARAGRTGSNSAPIETRVHGSDGDAGVSVTTPPQRSQRAAGHAGTAFRVAILRGCVQQGLFARVNRATADVLRANGCTIVPAPAQGCCGALHAHAGALDDARQLARANILALEAAGVDRIVVNAAGCGALMKEYGELFEGTPDHDRAQAFAKMTVDLSELLVTLGPRSGGEIRVRAAYDAPCHLIHAQRIDREPTDMLAAVPGLDVVHIAGADECCGGAGTYGLTHPVLGGRILDDKVRAVQAAGADVVITPNPGCMMQIGAGLRLHGDSTPVLHPVELLAESYRRLRND